MPTPQQNKLLKLLAIQLLRSNLGKVFPVLKYASSEEAFLQEIKNLLGKDFEDMDLKWVLKIPLEALCKDYESELCVEIEELRKKVKLPGKKAVLNPLF